MNTTPLKETSKKNFGLTKESFDQMVKAMQQGDDQLFERIYLHHFDKCVLYLMNHCGADYESAYSSTMDTLLEIRKDLIQGKIEYGNLAYFYTYRAKRKYSKIKTPLSIVGQPDETVPDQKDFLQNFISEEMTALIGKAISNLGEDCVELIKLYYYDDLTWPQIARVYYPKAELKLIETKSNTLKRRTKRKCLPAFKDILKRLL